MPATGRLRPPYHSDPRDERDAELVGHQFGLPVVRIDLAPAYDLLVNDLNTLFLQLASDQAPDNGSSDLKARVPLANIKARLRMSSLYFIANSLDYLVVGTGNRSELSIGYFTKHGDGAADLLPLGRLLKSEVRELASDLEIPQSIIDKPPSAGLWAGQTASQFGEQASLVVLPLIAVLALTADPAQRRLMRTTEHKRAPARMPDK
jgi:NAD+ synthase